MAVPDAQRQPQHFDRFLLYPDILDVDLSAPEADVEVVGVEPFEVVAEYAVEHLSKQLFQHKEYRLKNKSGQWLRSRFRQLTDAAVRDSS